MWGEKWFFQGEGRGCGSSRDVGVRGWMEAGKEGTDRIWTGTLAGSVTVGGQGAERGLGSLVGLEDTPQPQRREDDRDGSLVPELPD